MKKVMMALVLVSAVVGQGFCADTIEKKAEKLVKSVQDGCSKELSSYCKDVTPGEGRVLACLYAFGDKLSGQCEYALYDAAAQLQNAVVKLSYVANECNDDLQKYCANVEMGQGRVMNCLKTNSKKISDRCNQAVKDVSK